MGKPWKCPVPGCKFKGTTATDVYAHAQGLSDRRHSALETELETLANDAYDQAIADFITETGAFPDAFAEMWQKADKEKA